MPTITPAPSYRLEEIAAKIGATIAGDKDTVIRGVCSLDQPAAGCISFFKTHSTIRLQSVLTGSKIAALIVETGTKIEQPGSVALLFAKDPHAALVKLIPLFHRPLEMPAGISPKAHVDPSASIGKNVSIGAFCAVGAHVTIGDGAVLHPSVVLYAGCRIGARAVLHSGAVVREECIVGDDCIVQNGAIIGADGFGYVAAEGSGVQHIPQIGVTTLGAHVEIGANSCVDRAALGSTTLKEGVKLDNHVQVAHNVTIGAHSILCAQVGVAGSVTIGSGVTLGGNVGVSDHVSIASGARVAGKSGVTAELREAGDYGGYPAVRLREWKREMMALRRLPEILPRLLSLVKKSDDD